MSLLRNLLRMVGYHVNPLDLRAGEQMASLTLYPTSRRNVHAEPQTRPCPHCEGAGGHVSWTHGCRSPDPQSEETCPECEGSGIEGGAATTLDVCVGIIEESMRAAKAAAERKP